MTNFITDDIRDFYEKQHPMSNSSAIAWYLHCDGLILTTEQRRSLEDVMYFIDTVSSNSFETDGWKIFSAVLGDILKDVPNRLDEEGFSLDEVEKFDLFWYSNENQ